MVKGIDGISYLPLLTGNGEVSRSHEYIYYEFYEQGRGEQYVSYLHIFIVFRSCKCRKYFAYLPQLWYKNAFNV